MANKNVLNALYNKRKSPLEVYFDTLIAPPLLSLLTPQDIFELNRIARSVKLAGKIDEKYRLIDNIMNNRGFVKLHAGTNRVVYRFIEDQTFVIKVAIDRVGLNDNPDEYKNQFLLKPFVTKVFEISPCGTVGLFERVDAIMSREEFLSVADDIFNLVTKFFVGKYILEDFGTHYFMNWGIRRNGFGLVLLDFPYVYELDGNKLYCNAPLIPGQKFPVCNGQLDYDDGFNNLICTKCGRHYQAKDLKKAEQEKLIIVGGKKKMKVRVKIGNDVIVDSSKNKVSTVIEEPTQILEKKEILRDKVKNRVDQIVEPIIEKDKPLDSIFNVENINNNIVNESKTIKEDTETEDIAHKSVEDVSENHVNDEYDSHDSIEFDDEDEYDYDQYLSNRQRSNNKSKKKSKNNNKDFSDF